jgi:hypothetical protein
MDCLLSIPSILRNVIDFGFNGQSGCTAVETTGYGMSMPCRKRIEQGFGWAKFIGSIRQVMVRGLRRVDQLFVLNMAAYSLVRMRSLGRVRLQVAG